jgi:hypothetical protein
MLGQFYPLTCLANCRMRLSLALALVMLTGCVQTKTLKPELTLEVQPTGKSGVYAVSGQTTLPNRSRITIQAMRQLEPGKGSRLTNQKPVYSILDRQQVEVTDGKWQANLTLLRNMAGAEREPWQISSSQIGLALQPKTDVTFWAVSDKLDAPLDIRTTKDSNQPLENAVLQFSRDGSAYLQAKQTLAISAPLVKATLRENQPTKVKLTATSISSKVSPESKPQNEAPLSPAEYLR